jgi:hypothetical protein
MYRRTALILAGMTLLGLAVPQSAFAQSEPFAGLWQVNIAKSTFGGQLPEPYVNLSIHTAPILPKSVTAYLQPDGQNIKMTVVFIRTDGTPSSIVRPWIFDGMPHPDTAGPNFDAIVFTRANTNTVIENRLKAGQTVQTETIVLSEDGKTMTVTFTDANGRASNATQVWEKQQ